MSQHQTKKARKEFRREYGKAARTFAEQNENVFKPKPKWVPMSWWLWAMSIFIKIRK